MQLAARARRRHVQDARPLEPPALPAQPPDVARQRALAAHAGGIDRRQQQFRLRAGSRQFEPVQERLRIAPLRAADARDDHHVPFQALGAVHGEYLDGTRRARRFRSCVELVRKLVEGVAGQQFRTWLVRERLDELLRIEQRPLITAGRRPAQAQPGPVHALPQRQRTLRAQQRRSQRTAQAPEAQTRVGIKLRQHRRVVHKIPQRVAATFGKQLELLQRESQLRRVQQG